MADARPRRDADHPRHEDAATALARYYDLDLQDDPGDLALYSAMAARTGGPVLELACGSGRLAVPLAAEGHAVTGVDHDPAMLERARRAWTRARPRRAPGSLELIEADLTSLRLPGRFGLVFLALNSLLLLADAEAQEAALRTMAHHLQPDGRAIVDVSLPDGADLAAYDGRLILDWLRTDPETGELVTRQSSARHDTASATVELIAVFDAVTPAGGPPRRTIRRDRLRLLGVAELCRMARDAGLSVEVLAEDHQITPIGPGAERVVLVAGTV